MENGFLKYQTTLHILRVMRLWCGDIVSGCNIFAVAPFQ